jgi:hypothetical protein
MRIVHMTQYTIRNTQYAIRNTQYTIRNIQYAIRNTHYIISFTNDPNFFMAFSVSKFQALLKLIRMQLE